jgi:hypothetical protein
MVEQDLWWIELVALCTLFTNMDFSTNPCWCHLGNGGVMMMPHAKNISIRLIGIAGDFQALCGECPH